MPGPESNQAGPTKVTHISAYRTGGAGRAMMRISAAIAEADSEGSFTDDFIIGAETKTSRRLINDIQKHGYRVFSRGLFRPSEPGLHSVAAARTGLNRELAHRQTDIAHLHWIGDSTVSIEEIQKIPFPVVWTAHDMWLVNGAEHYSTGTRRIEGYKKSNRPTDERGPDVNRWTWMRKKKHWKNHFTVISPSQWLAREIQQSPLAENWTIDVIPYPLDTDLWHPISRPQARHELGIPQDSLFLLFGAEKGLSASQKGGHEIGAILMGLVSQIGEKNRPIVGVFGKGDNLLKTPFAETRDFSFINDDRKLALLYSSADLTIVPSAIEAFGNVVVESMACGTPVAAYDHYGPAELIDSGYSGILGEPFLPVELGEIMGRHILRRKNILQEYGEHGRAFIEREFNYKKIGTRYLETYAQTLSDSQNRIG